MVSWFIIGSGSGSPWLNLQFDQFAQVPAWEKQKVRSVRQFSQSHHCCYLIEPAGNGSLVGDGPVVAVWTGVPSLAHSHHEVPESLPFALFLLFFLILGESKFWVISIKRFDYWIKHPLPMRQNLFNSRNQHSDPMYFGTNMVLSISLLLFISSLTFAFMLSLPLASLLVVH